MLLEIVKAVPEVDMVVQQALRTGFQSMQAATMILDAFDGKTLAIMKIIPVKLKKMVKNGETRDLDDRFCYEAV